MFLCHVCKSDDNKNLVAEKNGIEALVSLMKQHANQPEVVWAACELLFRVAAIGNFCLVYYR